MSNQGPTELPAAEPPLLQLCLCRMCGAACEVGAKQCWVCHAPASAANPFAPTADPVLQSRSRLSAFDAFFTGLLITCAVLAILLTIGLSIQDPGLGFGFLVLISPAFIVTGVRALVQASQGKTRPGSLVMSMLMTFVVTIAVVVLLVVALVVMLCVACINALSY